MSAVTNTTSAVTQQLVDGMAEAQRQAARMIWTAITQQLRDYWAFILMIVVGLIAVAVWQLVAFGRWGMLASIAYRAVYLGLLSLIICMAGPEAMASSWWPVVGVVIGAISFELVGSWLNLAGFRSCHKSRIML